MLIAGLKVTDETASKREIAGFPGVSAKMTGHWPIGRVCAFGDFESG